MNYIYDVLLNFSDEELYEFYEWNAEDYYEYIKCIPLFKLNDKTFDSIKNNDVIINKSFLNKIYENTEAYCDKLVKVIDYACLVTNGQDVIAIELDHTGHVIMKSSLLLDEADEAVALSETMKVTALQYEIIKYHKKDLYLTRNEKKIIFLLNRELNNVYSGKKIDKLKYYYYECFNKTNNDIDIIYKELRHLINGEWSIKHSLLYNLIRLSYTKKL